MTKRPSGYRGGAACFRDTVWMGSSYAAQPVLCGAAVGVGSPPDIDPMTQKGAARAFSICFQGLPG